jgi:hypothetical protein
MSDPVPEELRDFIARHIDSVAQLEALLLVRSASDQYWDVPVVARRLYISDQEASDTLSQLAAHGLLATEADRYRFAPQTQELLDRVDVLAERYKRQLIPITNLIHAKPRRIRQFADAFKLKKD